MKYLLFTLILISNQTFSQHDTTFIYYNKSWIETTKDSAYFISKVAKENKGWHRLDYWKATGNIQMDGYYKDEATKKRQGVFIYYNEDGSMKDSSMYVNDSLKYLYAFYSNHAKKAFVLYNETEQKLIQVGYSPNGTEIPGYVYIQPATFPGGSDVWVKYLKTHLLKGAPRGYKKGQMSGTVTIRFLIDKEGNVAATEVAESSGYAALDNHAKKIIENSPRWIPAVKENEIAPYWHNQQISMVCVP